MFRLTDGAARIFTVIPLFVFPLSVHGQLAITSKFQSGRERECTQRGKEKKKKRKEEEEKSPEKSHFAEPGIRTHDLLVMSRVFYPLGHGATPAHDNVHYDRSPCNK